MLENKICLPKFIKRLLVFSYPGSTFIGYLIARLFGYNSCEIELVLDSARVSFKMPIRSRANYRLIRGAYEKGRYNYKKPYESGLTSFLIKWLKPGSTFLDLGANRGYFSVIAGKLAGEGRVFSFEPNPRNFIGLYENVVLLNQLTNVYMIPLAASDKASSISLIRPTWGLDDGTGYYMTNSRGSEKSVVIPAEKADRLIGDFIKSDIDMVKIDVEAAELMVLKGMKEILARTRAIYVEVSQESKERFGLDYSEVFQYMKAAGFDAHALNESGDITPLDGRIISGDVVFIQKNPAGK